MKLFVCLMMIFTFGLGEIARALPPCEVLLQLDPVTSPDPGKQNSSLSGRLGQARRSIDPGRWFFGYRDLRLDAIDALVALYQNDPAALESWKQDFLQRVSVGSYKPEEWFAYLMLSRPEQGRKFVEYLAQQDGLWVRTRGLLIYWLEFQRGDVKASLSKAATKFSFPKRVRLQDFEKANIAFLSAIDQADFKNPGTLETLSTMLLAMHESFAAMIAQRDYRGGAPAIVQHTYGALLRTLFESDVLRRQMIMEYRNNLEHPERVDQWLKDLPEKDRDILSHQGRDAYLNYLTKKEGKWKALGFAAHLVSNSLFYFALAMTAKHFMPGGLSYTLIHGSNPPKPSPDPQGKAQAVLDIIDQTHLPADKYPQGTFDPLEQGYIGDLPVDFNNPDGPTKPNPCDPKREIQKKVDLLFTQMTEDEFDRSPRRDEWLNEFRASINRYWNDPRSGCKESYKAWSQAFDNSGREPSSVHNAVGRKRHVDIRALRRDRSAMELN